MKFLLTFCLTVLTTSFVVGQCAFDYIDNYAARRCNDSDTVLLFNARIEPVTFSKVVISNFFGIENQDMFGNEDEIIADLNCTGNSLTLESTTVYLSVVSASLHFSGSGTLYPDSIRVLYHQINPDGEQDICITYIRGSSVNTAENHQLPVNNLKIWPNPTNAFLNLETITEQIMDVKLFDSQGRLCNIGGSDVNQINIEDYPTGLYSIQVRLTDNTIITRRILKE